MARDGNREKTLTRRSLIMAGAQVGLFSVLAGRMYYLQVIESDQYKMLAEDNRINLRLLPPLRGRILDRFGVELASNQQNYRVLLIPEQTRSVDYTLAQLAEHVPLAEHERRRILRDVNRMRGFVPVTVSENLNWEQFARINLYSPELPGVQPDVGETRSYPMGPAFSHVVGYVAAPSEDDLGPDPDPLLQLPGFRVGKSGIERAYDTDLRGKAGNSRVEVNAFGRVIRELTRRDGQPGEDIHLTIDADIQQFATERFGEEAGACVVMDVHAGEVLALVSTPGFEPNAFNLGLSRTEWQALIGNPRKPMVNKAIAGTYPPGSTFKMAVALAALESGSAAYDHRVYCPGHYDLGDHRFHCWKKGGHGELDVHGALEQSCDVFFYDVARRVGVDKIAAYARRLGFGTRLGLELPGEKEGLVPTREWRLATTGVPWQQGETLNTGIGQGYLLATPLQLCTMTARIANGGKLVEPRLVRGKRPLPRAEQSLGLSPAALRVVLEGMNAVSNRARGNAYKARITQPGYALAGKTGTSQVRRISKQEHLTGRIKNEDKPYEERDHALFVAFAPVDAPRYALAVVIEHGGGGSTAAAPIARDIMLYTQQRNPLSPVPNEGFAGLGERKEG